MADDTTEPTTEVEAEQPTNEVEQPEAKAVETPSTESTTEGEEGQEPAKLSYEDLESALAVTRKESAGYRTRLRQMEDQLKGAKSSEEIEAIVATAVAEREAVELNLLREAVAARAGLPDALAEVLKGSTREELEEHAKVLSQFAPATETKPEPSGGLRPGSAGDEWFDKSPEELAAYVKKNPYFKR